MARRASDHLHRVELAVLCAGAVAASALLSMNASDELDRLRGGELSALLVGIYGLKLLLLEAALLAPFLVLALLGRSLLRETGRCRYRCAGLAISVSATLGVVGMLVSGLIAVDLEQAMDTLIGNVVPALVLLTVCAALYGGLIRLAQQGRLEAFTPGPAAPASRPAPE